MYYIMEGILYLNKNGPVLLVNNHFILSRSLLPLCHPTLASLSSLIRSTTCSAALLSPPRQIHGPPKCPFHSPVKSQSITLLLSLPHQLSSIAACCHIPLSPPVVIHSYLCGNKVSGDKNNHLGLGCLWSAPTLIRRLALGSLQWGTNQDEAPSIPCHSHSALILPGKQPLKQAVSSHGTVCD